MLLKNKVIISGSSGFVGQNLIAYLRDAFIETVLPSRKELYGLPAEFFSRSAAIIHLAGKAHDLKNTSEPDEYYKVNYDLTKKLYDTFLQSEATKFIFISSVKAAADKVDGILTEDFIPSPETHYGKSKFIAEEYIQSQPLPEGKSYYILRPCMIHGPGNKGNLNLLFKFISKGIPYPLTAFDNKRSFLSIDNLCFIIKEILERDDIPSGIYNVADDESLSTNELISIIAEGAELKPRLLNINKRIILGLAKLGDLMGMPLNSEKLQKLTENYVVDNSKIKSVLGMELPVTARKGILKTIRSFR
ncbi:NAD-dependent epimerase/dehydratase family protein [Pedobacter sp. HMF7647]|uniref:NAD-dependent epimerase/dehydratase family protein n=1 Tax=Hufsiella arboris TaxID=2695275 RepID=A0A7K1YAV3_9SPHI|nr:NAD-dependent epimerase/dehydratase family protein [Hufsiella arboris]MXV51713.1 NAD-dependent epimerase/dehydratase family protein [Hufsiella arboris]